MVAPGSVFADGVHHLGMPQRGHSLVRELLQVLQVRSSWGEEASVDYPCGADLYRFRGPHNYPTLYRSTLGEPLEMCPYHREIGNVGSGARVFQWCSGMTDVNQRQPSRDVLPWTSTALYTVPYEGCGAE